MSSHQEDSPEGNRIAQRDYYEKPVIHQYPPRPTAPGLIRCPECGYPGLSPSATSCPNCHHDFIAARLMAYRARKEKHGMYILTTVAAVLSVYNLYMTGQARYWQFNLAIAGLLWVAVGVTWLIYWWRWRR